MNDEQIHRLVDPILKRSLGGHGYESVVVRSGEDHDGEQALFVEIFFGPSDPAWTGSKANSTQGELWSALRDSNESRFPYVRFNLRHGDNANAIEQRVRDLMQA